MTERMDTEKILSKILEIGEGMLTCGGEVSRVEDSITRLCRAYQMKEINVFTITESIVVTVTDAAGQVLTQTRRVGKYKTDFIKLEKFNELSRRICSMPVPVGKLSEEISRIEGRQEYGTGEDILAYVLVSGAFSIFFGGSIRDGIAASLVGVFLYVLVGITRRLEMNYIVSNLLCSFFGGGAAVLLYKLGIAQSVDKVIIGNIMLLIPGINLTNSIRDMINGDLISGMNRLCEAVLAAIALSLGFTITLLV
ncbi:MAG: threonine/serine exporter family protein [Eubacterium sp.]|nr:threonine/serine exporter family protein [Eubacterium sp.]MDD7209047.1 threonine/serine exporter family protein [Lachnospiraceae bacterium]MDY5496439.1 threonine/serine exporter family protein [Anaerobutyricum sp.]